LGILQNAYEINQFILKDYEKNLKNYTNFNVETFLDNLFKNVTFDKISDMSQISLNFTDLIDCSK